MAYLPPPDHAADLLDDEPVQPKPAPIILHHAPAQPEGYVGDDDMEDDEEKDPDEDPEEETVEQVIPEPNNMDGFAPYLLPQPEGNMNGWLIEDDDEEIEEDGVDDDDDEEMDEDDEDNDGNDNEDKAEVINAYEEVDPLNRPPPTSDEETEFAPPVVPIVDVDDEPIPPVIQFGHNFHVRESSSAGALLKGNNWVHVPGPMGCNLGSVHRVVTRLDKQMFDRYKTKKKMAKKFKEDEFCMNRHEYDITTLDTANRRAEHLSHWEAWVRGRIPAQLRFQEEPPIHSISAPRADDPYAMVRNAAMAAREDDDDGTTAPRDPQPSEPHGFPRDLIMPSIGMSAAVISKLVANKVVEALESNRNSRNNPNVAGGSGGNGGQGGAPPVRECTFDGFMKCGPTQFYGNEGAVELCHWFEKTKSVFRIIATLGLDVVNGKSWTDMRKMMMEELCPGEEVRRLENELRSLKLRDTNIASYTQWFNELALLCSEAVPTEKKKVELYSKGLPENIKGETTSSKPAVLNEAICVAHTLMEQKNQDKAERVAENNKRKWERNNNQSGNNNNRNNYKDNTHHHQHNNRRQGNVKAMTTAPAKQGGHTGNKPFCNHCKKRYIDYYTIVCNNCRKISHIASDYKGKAVATGANAHPILTCYECGEKGHSRNRCPKRNDPQGGNATGRAYAIREAEKG
ncbi:putative reverse transcriptase domain-containing protein [Tanacetum coccineum]